jgi:hypothetical protein
VNITPEMIEAGRIQQERFPFDVAAIFRAMLAAAPPAPVAEVTSALATSVFYSLDFSQGGIAGMAHSARTALGYLHAWQRKLGPQLGLVTHEELARAYLEGATEAHQEILDWCAAYPLSVFPEPDMAKAHEALQAAGMTLDAVSASVIRHTLRRVEKIARAALAKAGADAGRNTSEMHG